MITFASVNAYQINHSRLLTTLLATKSFATVKLAMVNLYFVICHFPVVTSSLVFVILLNTSSGSGLLIAFVNGLMPYLHPTLLVLLGSTWVKILNLTISILRIRMVDTLHLPRLNKNVARCFELKSLHLAALEVCLFLSYLFSQ